MKTVDRILNQEPVYLNNWKNKEDVMSDFEYHTDWTGINILFASYEYANYSGDAWVLFEKDGKLYEVNGSHCSCYGLEGQWEPEDCDIEVLIMRLRGDSFGLDDWSDNNFRNELMEFLGITPIN